MCQVVWHRWTTSKEVVIIGRWDWRLALAALSQNGWKETKTEIQIGGCVSQCIHIGGCRGTPSICKYLNLWPVMKSLNGYHDVPWQIITFDMIWGCLYIHIVYIYICLCVYVYIHLIKSSCLVCIYLHYLLHVSIFYGFDINHRCRSCCSSYLRMPRGIPQCQRRSRPGPCWRRWLRMMPKIAKAQEAMEKNGKKWKRMEEKRISKLGDAYLPLVQEAALHRWHCQA